jgi:hypothetical protein
MHGLLSRLTVAVLFAVAATASLASEDRLNQAYAFWEANAFQCQVDGISFPSRPTGNSAQPCDDGDMTMFNGLLCYAGDERGCQGVRDAQDPVTGEWFRSPRIRLKGNDRGGASFSPDMAMGVQLYLIKTRDVERAEKWAHWLDGMKVRLCRLGVCVEPQSFCKPEPGCVIRPGDAASLAKTFDYLHKSAGMAPLRDGSDLRGYLSTAKDWGNILIWFSSLINKPGYSQHLVAVDVVIERMTSGKAEALKGEAERLAGKSVNEGNAFFSYLAGKDRAVVVQQVLARCPSVSSLPQPPLHQWQWERETTDKAWMHSCYWDCIFMAKLLGI